MEYIRPRLQKIPGGGMPIAGKDVYIKDLKELQRIELLEIKERQLKLLADKSKLQKLPDKGQRVRDFYDRIENELERRTNIEEAAQLFSKLNIVSEGERVINNMEWNGRLQAENDERDPSEDILDSDDEQQMDPLRIIAQRQMHKKKVKISKPEKCLITAEDLREIESFKEESKRLANEANTDSKENCLEDENDSKYQNSAKSIPIINADLLTLDVGEKLPEIRAKLKTLLPNNVKCPESVSDFQSKSSVNITGSDAKDDSGCDLKIEPHFKYLIAKTELQKSSGEKSKKKEKFLPHRTTISNVHDPSKERNRKLGKKWEVTAATPPLIQHNATQMLSLMDSVKIQAQYLHKIKELQEQHAVERLAARQKRLEERKLELPDEETLKSSIAFTKYRDKLDDIVNHIEGSCHFDNEWNEDEQQITEDF